MIPKKKCRSKILRLRTVTTESYVPEPSSLALLGLGAHVWSATCAE